MTARRKYKSTGPLADSGTAKTKHDPLCPSALCRCGHAREVHRARGKLTPCYPGYPQPFCPCEKFVLAKPKKPAAKKREKTSGLLPYVTRSTQVARVVGAPSVQQIPKMPTKANWSLEGPSPAQVQTARVLDGEEPQDYDDKWLDVPCRFSGNGHEGCFVAPVNRHGGPCVPCWARARQRMADQREEIAKLKGGST